MDVLFAFIHPISYSVSAYGGVQAPSDGFISSKLGFSVLFLKSVLCHAYIKIQIYQDRKWHVIVPKARQNPAVAPSYILALEEFF